MLPILYYISGHGYGHAVRSRQVIRRLKEGCPEIAIHVRTSAPEWLLQHPLAPVFYHYRPVDVGILQKDSLEMALEETLAACQSLHDRIPKIIDDELALVKREGIRLILGDIPPLCFEIAAAASLPSVAITNFTWDWIYRAYLPEFPPFLSLIREMEGFYRKASLALSLPFSCDLDIFPHQESISLIARVSGLDKIEARKKFGLPAAADIVLVSFGGFGLERLPWERLRRLGDFFFVTTARSHRKEKNFLVLPETQPHYEDLVRAADVVLSKPGYGIVADVIAHRVPILYTSRGHFPEYPFLLQLLKHWATSEFIPQQELLVGEVGSYLERLMEKEPNWPDVPLNGAQVAAERVLELADRG